MAHAKKSIYYAGIAALSIAFSTTNAIAQEPKQTPLSAQTQISGGVLSALQASYDVLNYTLALEIVPDEKTIKGSGTTILKVLQPLAELELDFDSRFDISAVTIDGTAQKFRREDGKVFITLAKPAPAGTSLSANIAYSGQPFAGENLPWDGGFVWSKAKDGSPWIATAVQGEGCDMWFPCKDHYTDKPETVDLHITVPAGIDVASNGVLVSIKPADDGKQVFHWHLASAISHYNIALNIGPYERIQQTYKGVNGTEIPLEFWALKENEAKARTLIEEDLLHELAFFERRLGPYPWGDSKLGFAETPHLGMEHQSINAYGNQYKRDAHGFDWLLQHELSHEWFGNVMTHERAADAWLHEGTGLYMQAAYSKDRFGNAAYMHTMYQSYLGLTNCKPVVGDDDTDMADAFHSDIYGKGGWVLHTLRGLIGEEAFWRSLRALIYDTPEPWDLPYPIEPRFRSTDDYIKIVSDEVGQDMGWFFDTYLYHAALPTLVQTRTNKGLALKWESTADSAFTLPVPVLVDGEFIRVDMPGGEGFAEIAKEARILIDPDMAVLRALPIIGTCEQQTEEQEARRALRKKQHEEEFGWDATEQEKE